MIRSKLFWAGTVMLAIIPLFVLDIPKHYVDWTREVHDETIEVVQNGYPFSIKQKAVILDHILDANKHLMAAMYLKGFAGVTLLVAGLYFLIRYSRQSNGKWRAWGLTILLLAITTAAKIYTWYSFGGDERIRLLTYTPADTTLGQFYNAHFKSKVVYIDFWGTTCGPCLEEFRNFTKPLKARYHGKDIAYLYICGGREAVWRQQLEHYAIEGDHIFLDTKAYARLFRRSVRGSKDTTVAMPRYLIMNKQGQIVEKDAPRPSDSTAITTLLDKYLAIN